MVSVEVSLSCTDPLPLEFKFALAVSAESGPTIWMAWMSPPRAISFFQCIAVPITCSFVGSPFFLFPLTMNCTFAPLRYWFVLPSAALPPMAPAVMFSLSCLLSFTLSSTLAPKARGPVCGNFSDDLNAETPAHVFIFSDVLTLVSVLATYMMSLPRDWTSTPPVVTGGFDSLAPGGLPAMPPCSAAF